MRSLLILMIFISCLFLTGAVQSAEEAKILDRPLIPTGFGLTQQFGEDYYLGRFSIDKSAIYRSAEDLVHIDAARRMEFKFVSSHRISGRTFGRQLVERMKINNKKESLAAHIQDIKRFKKFFKKNIKNGDVIRIDYHVNFGTRVYLNDRSIGSVTGELADTREFFGLILNIWFGEIPPSIKFKNGLLGQNGDDYALSLQRRYDDSQ